MKLVALRKLAAVAVLAGALLPAGGALAQARLGQRAALPDNRRPGPQTPAVVLWDQAPDQSGYYSSDNYAGHDDIDDQAADDFSVPHAFIWTVQTVTVRGFYDQAGSLVADSVLVQFYSSSNNHRPGSLLLSEVVPGGSISGNDTGEFVINLSNPLIIGAGQYWMAAQASVAWDAPPGNFRQWVWRESSDPQNLEESVWRQPGNAYGANCFDWLPRVTFCQRPSGSEHLDLSFELDGTVTPLSFSRYLPLLYR